MVNNPELLALEHINSEKPTTLSVLNKIFLNQNIVVNDLKLDQLLKVKGVEVDLTDSTPENLKLLAELTGKSAYKGFSHPGCVYTCLYIKILVISTWVHLIY